MEVWVSFLLPLFVILDYGTIESSFLFLPGRPVCHACELHVKQSGGCSVRVFYMNDRYVSDFVSVRATSILSAFLASCCLSGLGSTRRYSSPRILLGDRCTIYIKILETNLLWGAGVSLLFFSVFIFVVLVGAILGSYLLLCWPWVMPSLDAISRGSCYSMYTTTRQLQRQSESNPYYYGGP